MEGGACSCHHPVPRSKLSPMYHHTSENKAGCRMCSRPQPFSRRLPPPPSPSPTSTVVTGPAKGKGRPCWLPGPLAAQLAMVFSPGQAMPGQVVEGPLCGEGGTTNRGSSLSRRSWKSHGGHGERGDLR